MQYIDQFNYYMSYPVHELLGMAEPIYSIPGVGYIPIGLLIGIVALIAVYEDRKNLQKKADNTWLKVQGK